MVGVPQALHDADAMPGQVVVQRRRVRHQEVSHSARAGPIVPGHREVQFRCVPFQDGEPDRVTVLERHVHPHDTHVEREGPVQVPHRDGAGDPAEGEVAQMFVVRHFVLPKRVVPATAVHS